MPEDKRKFFGATLLIAACTFASNLLGLLRSTLISATWGATSVSDAYSAAFKLPDIIYTLVASGIISIVLIPYFLGVQKDGGKEELNRACAGFANIFFLVISGVILLGIVFAEPLVKNVLLSGWTDTENLGLAIRMSRIILIQVFFFTLSSVFGSYLNALEKFTAFSLALLSYNVGIIAGILVFSRFLGIEGVAWGVVFGGLLHFSIQFAGARKNGYRHSFVWPRRDKNLGRLLRNGGPRILTLAMEQITRFFLVNLGSFLAAGSLLIFYNVENIAMVPYGLVAVSVSTTAFPIFIKYHNEGDTAGLYESLFEKIRLTVFLVLPLCVFMLIFRTEIADVLLGYRRYGAGDVEISARVLAYYCFGIPFNSLTLLIVKFYYAQTRSIIPMIIAFVSLGATVLLCSIFTGSLGVSGLSLGRTLGYALQAMLLLAVIAVLYRKAAAAGKTGAISAKPLWDVLKISAVCAALAAGAYYFRMIPALSGSGKLQDVIRIGAALVLSVPLYFLLTALLKVPEGGVLLRRLRRSSRDTDTQ